MKFEKLNENKIRITLNTQDLIDKNIDFHSFMSNSQESQNLFLDMLDEAEKKVGFITKDYKIKIEALAMSDGNFILTITRFGKNIDSASIIPKRKNLKIKRKNQVIDSEQVIYKFSTFEAFNQFATTISKISNYANLAKNCILYSYKNVYYLCFTNINTNHPNLKKIYTIITEFSTYIDNPELFSRKLVECGTVVMKNNAIKNCNKVFGNKK